MGYGQGSRLSECLACALFSIKMMTAAGSLQPRCINGPGRAKANDTSLTAVGICRICRTDIHTLDDSSKFKLMLEFDSEVEIGLAMLIRSI